MVTLASLTDEDIYAGGIEIGTGIAIISYV